MIFTRVLNNPLCIENHLRTELVVLITKIDTLFKDIYIVKYQDLPGIFQGFALHLVYIHQRVDS